MRLIAPLASIALIGTLLTACTKSDNGPDRPDPEPQQIGGAVQKGPFITGTTVTIRPLDTNLQPTGDSYET